MFIKSSRNSASAGAFISLMSEILKIIKDKDFYESAHPTRYGSLDMYRVMQALHDNGFDGYIRPDHGRFIWGETGRPGYGLYDRALGATYLLGLWEALENQHA